jgi:nucleotide-binding universal stress UspA family protein
MGVVPYLKTNFTMMKTTQQTILIPWDFTDKAAFALEHALVVAKITGNDIVLVHIIKTQEELEPATKRLTMIAENTHNEHGIEVKAIVREGSIFTTIGEVAAEIDADLVIMGTHGVKGMQKITGSWALKVIVSAKVPFLVVQAPPASQLYEKVVFPIDFKKENREKLAWVNYFAKHYHSKIYIIRPQSHDAKFKKETTTNIVLAKKYLEDKNIEFEIKISDDKVDFANATINYSKEIGADVILVMTTKNINLADYILGAPEQQIIANEAKIPVMCINPRPPKLGWFSAQGAS